MFKTVFFIFLLSLSALFTVTTHANEAKHSVTVGAEQPAMYLPQLQNKRVGLVVNQTSLVDRAHLVDSLLTKNINITKIFAPEHGFRGDHDAGAHVKNAIDSKTGIPLTTWPLFCLLTRATLQLKAHKNVMNLQANNSKPHNTDLWYRLFTKRC